MFICSLISEAFFKVINVEFLVALFDGYLKWEAPLDSAQRAEI